MIALLKFARSKMFFMDYGGKYVKHRSLCLECGNVIRYGRTDKKFCCEDCKTKHHNYQAKAGRVFRTKILKVLDKNYGILDDLLRSGEDSADLAALKAVGFMPGVVTSFAKAGKHNVFTCYDIKYIMTETRVYSLVKIQNLSVHL